ncbi:hypothetical protein I302_107789 [Kwoniella bestiolae CBS 10118]|uniref:Uncharacterized protein n=1 Tax=Kwoniella bestiolae CBS 10118 TaxID=1296100 RepID=A0A1B9FXL4_9TREE|nr:hypothetical protein I302_06473 [Kwoniella bestiolae CBS 10118]OCF23490.1 hypothetical protein I302_06473 [Kwoniella bestiolae CBS 10118]
MTTKHDSPPLPPLVPSLTDSHIRPLSLTDELAICRSRIIDLERSNAAYQSASIENNDTIAKQSEEIRILRRKLLAVEEYDYAQTQTAVPNLKERALHKLLNNGGDAGCSRYDVVDRLLDKQCKLEQELERCKIELKDGKEVIATLGDRIVELEKEKEEREREKEEKGGRMYLDQGEQSVDEVSADHQAASDEMERHLELISKLKGDNARLKGDIAKLTRNNKRYLDVITERDLSLIKDKKIMMDYEKQLIELREKSSMQEILIVELTDANEELGRRISVIDDCNQGGWGWTGTGTGIGAEEVAVGWGVIEEVEELGERELLDPELMKMMDDGYEVEVEDKADSDDGW